MWTAARHAAAITARVSAVNKQLGGIGARVPTSVSILGRSTGRRTFILSTARLAARANATTTTTTRPRTRSTTGTKRTTTRAGHGKPGPKKKAAPKKKKAASKKKKVVKKKPTAEQLRRKEITELREIGLLNAEPKKLPYSAWTVFTEQYYKANRTPGTSVPAVTQQLSSEYKSLRDSELQALKTTAEQNHLANQATLKNWVASYTPQQIIAANNARHKLKRLKATSKPHIPDDRKPKKAATPWVLFTKSRFATGEYAGRAVNDVVKSVSEEWKSLSDAQRQPFVDAAETDRQRYAQQVRSVLGREVRHK